MPTYANQITAGGGKFRVALTIEGWPYIYVSDESLVRTRSDGREQINGLDAQTVRIAASVDLLRAKLEASEQTFEIIDDSEVVRGFVARAGSVTASLSKRPTATTNMVEDLAAAGTTITVASTDGFASTGVVHINGEAIKYGGKTATTFTTLTRGHWDTTAQAHFTGNGETLAYPKVTDLPRTLRGRRVSLALWGAADSATGDGTRRWRGVVRTDVSFVDGRYSFGVEPVSWILEQMVGGDLEDPVPMRGKYLPSAWGLRLELRRLADANAIGADDATDQGVINMSGFWETNADFVADLNTELATLTSGWTWDADAEIHAESHGPFGWSLTYRAGTTVAHYVKVVSLPLAGGGKGLSLIDVVAPESSADLAMWVDEDFGTPAALVIATTYSYNVSAFTPSSIVVTDGLDRTRPGRPFVDLGGLFPANRVYFGGTFVPTVNTTLSISIGDDDATVNVPVLTVSASERYAIVQAPAATVVLTATTEIKALRILASEVDVGGLIDALIADSPGLVNSGAMPLITADDIDTASSDVDAASRALRVAIRTWIATEGLTLSEILMHELRLIGMYPALDADGTIVFLRLRAPMITDEAAFTLDASVLSGGSVSENPLGHVKEVVFRQGWDPTEGEHTGLNVRVRDVSSADPTPSGAVLEVAPRSIGQFGSIGLEITPADAEVLGLTVLGLFGGAYRVYTVQVALPLFEAVLGTVGVLTAPRLPDVDGTMGIVNEPVLVTGYDWSPFEGQGSMTLLGSSLRIGGYSPSVLIASQVNDSGNIWTITVTLTGYTSSTAIADWFAVGDEVRVMERGSASPTIVTGDISATGTGTDAQIEVTFDATWTPPGSSWYLMARDTGSVDEVAPSGRRWAQIDFAAIGDVSTHLVSTGSVDIEPTDFAP